ncbi:BQ2448_2245 [Microbotryum intermedium]|uniref:BQ2448_2245 protein n=1 Tax=Microbotryum intermedium TaxID=269621 RepID=A0A238F7P9_9BASI|nr:BQ2448_2245 [Microbotryum intermedium]
MQIGMASETGQTLTTRDLVESVPLIKSPSFWVPEPVELPPDIHPLPDSVEPYVHMPFFRPTIFPQQFVYPFTIENHALSVLPAALDALRTSHAQRLERLRSYSEAKEKARKAHLNAVAPGWTGDGGIILPSTKKTSSTLPTTLSATATSSLSSEFAELSVAGASSAAVTSPSDPMRDFVEGLDSLESKSSTTTAPGGI